MRASRDIPLAEITLRKYPKPFGLSEREMVKKICLSVGLLQPGDSRDVIVDVLHVMIKAKNEKNAKEIEDQVKKNRKKHKLPMQGVASSNLRRQIRRLREMFLLEKIKNKYRITENEPLSNIFAEKIEKYYLDSILVRVREYFDAIQK